MVGGQRAEVREKIEVGYQGPEKQAEAVHPVKCCLAARLADLTG